MVYAMCYYIMAYAIYSYIMVYAIYTITLNPFVPGANMVRQLHCTVCSKKEFNLVEIILFNYVHV